MSLIPYHARDGREILLRHHNAIVVRDPASQRLEIRGLAECPTCHQPFRASSPDRHFDSTTPERETYVDPDYFRMLRAGNGQRYGHVDRPPSSPIRRLVEPFTPEDDAAVRNAEFMSSTPAVQEGNRIRRESFSPNYFNTFFIEERELGRGGKAVVLLVRHEIDGCHLGHFACKRVPVGNDHAWLEKVLIEVELLAQLSHPNLVSYRHVWLEDVQLNRFGPSVACAFILQQYCNSGDLHRYVIGDLPKETTKEELKAQMRRRSKGNAHADRPQGLFPAQRRLQFDEIYSLFKDVTSGLAYLHAANYIHRDLKPSNCLLHREGGHLVCLISDFGEVQPENAVRKSTGSTGTISYCAPEVLKKDATGRYGNFTTKSDVFSLGMILYFMCFGRLPYRSANTVQEELEDIDLLRAEITDWKGFQDERRERPDLPSKLYQLLKKMLALNPLERPSTNEVLTAMKTDASLDGMPRAAQNSNPSIGLAGRRIQNLDSPMAPSTPIPDPTKHAKVASSPDEDLAMMDDSNILQNSLQKHTIPIPPPNTTRHRHSHSMALSRSQEGYSRGAARSPERNHRASNAGLSRSQDRELDSDLDHLDHASLTTPLLMPPPTTFLGEIRHRGSLVLHQASQNREQLTFIAKLSLFLIKMATLAQICWPYSVSRGIGASLIAIAGVDLGVPWLMDRENNANRLPLPLSQNPPHPHFEDEDGGGSGRHEDHASSSDGPPLGMEPRRRGSPAVAGQAQQQQVAGAAVWRRGWEEWGWDWRASAVLLVFHFAILGVTSRYGALCAVLGREEWERW